MRNSGTRVRFGPRSARLLDPVGKSLSRCVAERAPWADRPMCTRDRKRVGPLIRELRSGGSVKRKRSRGRSLTAFGLWSPRPWKSSSMANFGKLRSDQKGISPSLGLRWNRMIVSREDIRPRRHQPPRQRRSGYAWLDSAPLLRRASRGKTPLPMGNGMDAEAHLRRKLFCGEAAILKALNPLRPILAGLSSHAPTNSARDRSRQPRDPPNGYELSDLSPVSSICCCESQLSSTPFRSKGGRALSSMTPLIAANDGH